MRLLYEDNSVSAEPSAAYSGRMTAMTFSGVKGDADVAAAAALLAEPTRAELVLTVIERGALPASELAACAGIARPTASEHLARLVDGGFLTKRKSGRHSYYDLADPTVAEAVEALSRVAPRLPVRSLRDATRSELIQQARTCYDHLAGRLGVALARALEHRRVLIRDDDAYRLGPNAEVALAGLGIDLDELARQRRPLVRGCLDWTERDLHVAGAVGAAITSRLFELGWIERREQNRSVAVTAEGSHLLRAELGVDVDG
jgi:DNA-binding transcriptional ArsR family regulator